MWSVGENREKALVTCEDRYSQTLVKDDIGIETP